MCHSNNVRKYIAARLEQRALAFDNMLPVYSLREVGLCVCTLCFWPLNNETNSESSIMLCAPTIVAHKRARLCYAVMPIECRASLDRPYANIYIFGL